VVTEGRVPRDSLAERGTAKRPGGPVPIGRERIPELASPYRVTVEDLMACRELVEFRFNV
jgi:hypothetical protein